MKISAQLLALQKACETFAQANGKGAAHIANDKSHVGELLSAFQQKPGALRILIHCPSGDIRELQNYLSDVISREDRSYHIILTYGRGLRLDAAASLTTGAGGGRPVLDLLEELRDVIRAVKLDPQTCERPPVYKGFQALDLGDQRTDAFEMLFTIGTLV